MLKVFRARLSNLKTGQAFGPPPNEITLQSGLGYAGSVLAANPLLVGQWYAGETAIPGATSSTFTMLPQYEGDAITFRSDNRTSNTIQVWSPRDLPNKVMWNDAMDSSSIISSGGRVSRWNSRVGAKYLAQATAGIQPELFTNDGRPTVAATAGDRYMNFDSITGLPVGSNPSFVTGAFFSHSTNAAGWRGVFHWGASSGAGRFCIAKNNSNYVSATGGSTGTNTEIANDTWAAGSSKIVSNFMGGTRIDVFDANGQTFGRDVAVNTTGTANTYLNNPSNQYWRGGAYEFIIFNSNIDTTTRQKLEGYFAWRWNLVSLLAGDHPYKTVMPSV